ncbi:hypothetical protein EXIGLDRAFT_723016 [Exidia glandulosa HHB12029]|uniref:CREG-like beta-barrel domain-containing protein n=1 Tax=Exidia glandulosa HHB12029 TaxID=1314781 RepID=A0A165F073_EXIGL|nr:hypothetical protein EXIGLDRAFT_723016 [Exidia glandulosa HHB12029]
MEYYAGRCYQNGSLALVFLPISQNSRNILKSPTHAASVTVSSTPAAAANARVALLGSVEVLYDIDSESAAKLETCYTASHPDAAAWVPGAPDAPHKVRNLLETGELFTEQYASQAYWARFDPHTVYYVGGFGE